MWGKEGLKASLQVRARKFGGPILFGWDWSSADIDDESGSERTISCRRGFGIVGDLFCGITCSSVQK